MINIGIGIGWAKALYSVANNVIANFKARVLSYPNSIFEAGPCLDATLEELNAIGLLDNASLVITPNAYNEGILYDVVPNTTLGDMTVVRATTATRVNSAGLIEVVPRNLLTYSNTFNDASWVRLGTITITANTTISPTGTQDADTILGASGVSSIGQIIAGYTGVVYTSSFYIKNNNSTQSQLTIRNTITALDASLNWSGNTLTSITNVLGITTFTSVGNDWYRIISTYTSVESPQRARIIPTTSTNQSIFLWGAQLEIFPTATEYFPTTTRLNIPRIDYTNGSCPSLLVEPQRTNLLTYSEDLPSQILQNNPTIVNNSAISPSGVQNADKIIPTITAGFTGVVKTLLPNNTYSVSMFAKANGKNWIFMYELGSLSGNNGVWFNVNTGVLGTIGTAWTNVKIENYGSGWYRCSATVTLSSSNFLYWCLSDANNSTNVSVNGTDGVLMWGLSYEQGSYTTSYIPTVASTVTRNADVISKTGISSLIGQTEGTVFVDANLSANVNERRLVTVSNGNEVQRIFIWTLGTTLWASFNSGSVSLGNFPIGAAKIAVGYTISGANTTYSIKVNNNSLITGTTANAPNSLSAINLGSSATGLLQLNDGINSVQLYKTRLTDTEIASLTIL